MKQVNILLLFFSGTGNTKIATELLRDKYIAAGHSCDIKSLEEDKLDIDSYDLIGIGYPVYGFICPLYVVNIVKKLGFEGKSVFVYKTCANDHNLNSTSSYNLIKELNKSNSVLGDYTLPMASNWLFYLKDEVVKSNFLKTKSRIPEIVQSTLSLKSELKKIPTIRRVLLNSVGVFEEKVGATNWGRNLYITSSCTKCGLCEQKCPTGNIKNLKFGWKCIWCMRCIYSCPVSAIKARFFKSAILKNGYNSKSLFK